MRRATTSVFRVRAGRAPPPQRRRNAAGTGLDRFRGVHLPSQPIPRKGDPMLRLLATLAFALPCSMLPAQGWVDRTPTNPLQTPTPRAFPAMCWDGAHNYVLLFGGIIYNGGGGSSNETWSWNGTTWTRHLTTAQPGFSYWLESPQQTAMAYHAPSNQVVMFSGGATWVWTGGDWLLVP